MKRTSQRQKYKKEKVASIEYKAAPLAQLRTLEKKMKKGDTFEMAKLYNDKVSNLYSQIENLNTEIDNYKAIVAQLQQEMSSRSEIVTPEPEMKEDHPTSMRSSTPTSAKELKTQLEVFKQQSDYFKSMVEDLTKKNSALESQLNEKDKKIKELSKEKHQSNRSSSLPKTEEEVTSKLNEVLTENMFLMYLLDRSANYEKMLKELNSNFEKYFNVFIKEDMEVNNIFSAIFHEFLMRIHKRINTKELAASIFNKNCINQSEEYNIRYTENPFYTTGLIDDDLILELNKKVFAYRNESINEIHELIIKCQDMIQKTPELFKLQKFQMPQLFAFTDEAQLRINLDKLTAENTDSLISTIKYNEGDIKSIEMLGDVQYNKDDKCEEFKKVAYQIGESCKDKLLELIINHAKNVQEDFMKWINYLIEQTTRLKRVIVRNCQLDDKLKEYIKLKKAPYQYDILDFSYNKITKLSHFKDIQTTKLILSNNAIKFNEYDSLIKCTYLDISSNNFTTIDIVNFSVFMKYCSIKLLNFSGLRFNDQMSQVLGEALLSLPDLKVLYLNECRFEPRFFPVFISSFKDLNLLELYFNYNKGLTERCIKSFMDDFLAHSKDLIKLEMKKCNITINGATALQKAIEFNNTLKEINLEGNKLEKEEFNQMFSNEQDKIKFII